MASSASSLFNLLLLFYKAILNIMEGLQINAQANVKINAAAFAAKAKSKREIYAILTIDCKAYLPKLEVITIYFLKDLLSGKKKCKCLTYDIWFP